MGRASILAGVRYFASVFALGFVLGTLRMVVIEPRLGRTAATLVELPVMLAASWWLCGWVIRKHAVPDRWASRLGIGVLALALLLAAETLLGIAAFGRTLTEQLATYRETGPQLGLLAQLVFAIFPLLRLRLPRRPAG